MTKEEKIIKDWAEGTIPIDTPYMSASDMLKVYKYVHSLSIENDLVDLDYLQNNIFGGDAEKTYKAIVYFSGAIEVLDTGFLYIDEELDKAFPVPMDIVRKVKKNPNAMYLHPETGMPIENASDHIVLIVFPHEHLNSPLK